MESQRTHSPHLPSPSAHHHFQYSNPSLPSIGGRWLFPDSTISISTLASWELSCSSFLLLALSLSPSSTLSLYTSPRYSSSKSSSSSSSSSSCNRWWRPFTFEFRCFAFARIWSACRVTVSMLVAAFDADAATELDRDAKSSLSCASSASASANDDNDEEDAALLPNDQKGEAALKSDSLSSSDSKLLCARILR